MKKINLILLLSAVILSVSSCKKDDDATPATTTTTTTKTKTNSELLIGVWKFTSFTENGTEDSEACEKDDTEEFKANNVVVSNPGTVKCEDDDAIENDTYALSTDQKSLTLDGDIWTITSITETTLTLTFTDDDKDVYVAVLKK